jgi:hypothetical protein
MPMARPRHPNKEIQKAITYALSRGSTLVKASGHAWGILRCPRGARDGCSVSVWSTPRVPENHANQIRRNVEKCPHT